MAGAGASVWEIGRNRPGATRETTAMPPFSLADRIAALSPRERRVLVLLAENLPVDEISVAMGVSAQQVAGVRQTLRRKLAVPPGVRLADSLHQITELLPLAQIET